MDKRTRDLLLDINLAVHGKQTKMPVAPTSYSTFAGQQPDQFRVLRDGVWFEVSARVLEPHEWP